MRARCVTDINAAFVGGKSANDLVDQLDKDDGAPL